VVTLEYLEYEIQPGETWLRTIVGMSAQQVAAVAVIEQTDGRFLVAHRSTIGNEEIATHFVDLPLDAQERAVDQLVEMMTKRDLLVRDLAGPDAGRTLLHELFWVHDQVTAVEPELAGIVEE
jgi:hypothetical protein